MTTPSALQPSSRASLDAAQWNTDRLIVPHKAVPCLTLRERLPPQLAPTQAELPLADARVDDFTLTPAQVAAQTRLSRGTLAHWRMKDGLGAPFPLPWRYVFLKGRDQVRYSAAGVAAFIAAMHLDRDVWMTTADVAQRLGVTADVVRVWRQTHPERLPFENANQICYYRRDTVEAFARTFTATPAPRRKRSAR